LGLSERLTTSHRKKYVSRNLKSSVEWRGLIREVNPRYRAVAPQKKKKKEKNKWLINLCNNPYTVYIHR
jgi:hypothetical protein